MAALVLEVGGQLAQSAVAEAALAVAVLSSSNALVLNIYTSF